MAFAKIASVGDILSGLSRLPLHFSLMQTDMIPEVLVYSVGLAGDVLTGFSSSDAMYWAVS